MAKADEGRGPLNDLWKQAIDQLEEVKDSLTRSRGHIDNGFGRLRSERDKLLKRLGEQTYKLANQGKVPLPTVAKRTVDRLNVVIDNMVERQSGAQKTSKASKASGGAKSKAAVKARFKYFPRSGIGSPP